jgi:hypothetical protein
MEKASVGNDRRFFVAVTPRNAIKSCNFIRSVAGVLRRSSFHGRLTLRKDDA